MKYQIVLRDIGTTIFTPNTIINRLFCSIKAARKFMGLNTDIDTQYGLYACRWYKIRRIE